MKAITVNFTPSQVRSALSEYVQRHRDVETELGMQQNNFENEVVACVLSGLSNNVRLTLTICEEGSSEELEFYRTNGCKV
jgi:hypothetical protein